VFMIYVKLNQFQREDGIFISEKCWSSPCLNNGTCVDQANYYLCDCILGFTGANCREGMLLVTDRLLTICIHTR